MESPTSVTSREEVMDFSVHSSASQTPVDSMDTQIGYPAVYTYQSPISPEYTGYETYYNPGLAIPQHSWPLLPQYSLPIFYASTLTVNHPDVPPISDYHRQTVVSLPRDEIEVNVSDTNPGCMLFWVWRILVVVLLLALCWLLLGSHYRDV